RVLPSKVQARTFELLGAVPMPMDLTQAIAMVSAGTIDAQENPLSNTVTYGVHKFHRFHTLSNHFYISRPICTAPHLMRGPPSFSALREARVGSGCVATQVACAGGRGGARSDRGAGLGNRGADGRRARRFRRRGRAAHRGCARNLRTSAVRLDGLTRG